MAKNKPKNFIIKGELAYEIGQIQLAKVGEYLVTQKDKVGSKMKSEFLTPNKKSTLDWVMLNFKNKEQSVVHLDMTEADLDKFVKYYASRKKEMKALKRKTKGKNFEGYFVHLSSDVSIFIKGK